MWSITSTGLTNGTSTFSGTSQATPHAAGCAALLLDAGDAVTPDAIEAFLKASPVQVTDPKNGLTFPRIDCSPIIEVDIDIKPSDFPNSINPRSKGVIPVAILTTTVFDATTVDPLSVKFGPNGATEAHVRGHIEDVDGDGDLDLVLHFRTQDTGIVCGVTSASLTGHTFADQPIQGSDSIQTVGCK